MKTPVISIIFILFAAVIIVSITRNRLLSSELKTDSERKEIVHLMYKQYKKKIPQVKELAPSDIIVRIRNERFVFIDEREHQETSVSTLPHAITKKTYFELLEQNPNAYKDATFVAYCTIGYRSGLFAKEMLEKNMVVYNLKGGILGWIHEGGEVFDVHGKTNKVHVYGKKWNLLPVGYEAVW